MRERDNASEQHKLALRTNIRRETARFPEIIEGDPDLWWRKTARMVIGVRKKLEKCEDGQTKTYFEEYIQDAMEILREAGKLPIKSGETDKITEQAEHMIMGISMRMAERFEPEKLAVETHFMPLAEMVANYPHRFQTDEGEINGIKCIILKIKHPIEEVWQEVPLPIDKKTWHKGGPARAAMGIIANAPLSMQKSEFPRNDIDMIVAGERENIAVAIAVGADADGIELMGEDNLNFVRFCFGRDTQQNQVCLGAEGIYFSSGAFQSAATGHVNIVGEYVANKAIYGIDRMTVHGVDMAKQRGLMRLVKAVAEGKAISFDHVPLNANFDMGVHVLFLAKRWAKKGKFPEFSQKMYYLLGQMGQVREGEKDIFDVMERAHRENPFFDFDSEVRLQIEVVRWKSKKIVKQIDREVAWQLGLPSSMTLERFPGDSIPVRVSLDGFVYDTNRNDDQKRWGEFLERSRIRTTEQMGREKTMYERVFGTSYEPSSDLRPEK